MGRIRINRTLNAGSHRCIVMAPIGTNITVTALNPVLGMNPGPDEDNNSNVWNSIVTVPRKGQYTFLVISDRPINENELIIQFIEQANSGGGTGGGNNSSDLDGPDQPTVGWRFTYGMPDTDKFDVHVTINDLNGKYVIDYGGMWVCDLKPGKNFECVNAHSNLMKAWGGFSNDWKRITFSGGTFVLKKKQKYP